MTRARSIMVLIVGIFLAYAVVTQPESSAGVVRSIVDTILNWLGNIGTFFNTLIG